MTKLNIYVELKYIYMNMMNLTLYTICWLEAFSVFAYIWNARTDSQDISSLKEPFEP